jgi:hypothetical protein
LGRISKEVLEGIAKKLRYLQIETTVSF